MACRLEYARARRSFDALHAAELGQERLHLHRLAAATPFRRALAIGNPALAARWKPVDRIDALSNRARERRLEASVFHTLMRAVGRPTPQSAWAGIAGVRPTDQDDHRASSRLTIDTAALHRHFTVDLTPFHATLAALRRHPRYRTSALCLNPTLRRVSMGWRYERQSQSRPGWCAAPSDAACQSLIDAYRRSSPRPAAEVIRELAESDSALAATLGEAVDHLLAEDVLRIDIALPVSGQTVWGTLESVTPRLLPEDRLRWVDVINRIRHVCDRLTTDFDQLDPAEVDSLRQAVEADVSGLWSWVGLRGKIMQPVLHLDTCVPFDVRWTRSTREVVEHAVREVLSFHREDGAAERYRRTSLQGVVDALAAVGDNAALALLDGTGFRRIAPAGHDMDLHEQLFARFTGMPDRDVISHCAAWERRLQPFAADSSMTVDLKGCADHPPPGPAGAFAVSSLNGQNLVVEWGRPQAGMFVSRLAEALACRDGDVPLISELRQRIDAVHAEGVLAAEVVGSDPINLNTAIQPRITALRVDAHGADNVGLDDLRVELDPRELRPWLTRHAGERIVPTYQSAAAIGGVDPCSWLLFRLAMGHGWEFTSFGFPPLRRERSTWHHLPRLVLPTGTILSAERWTIPEETLRAIQACDESGRYLAWRAEVERRGLPSLVRVRWDVHPAASSVLMRTDSPLAVSALFLRLPEACHRLIVTEIPGGIESTCIRSPTGEHHFAELAISWYDDSYWNVLRREQIS